MEEIVNFDDPIELPPGFRFHPTDEELITHYLYPKIADRGFTSRAIGDVNLNRVEPWDLPRKAKMGEKEWYFFCVRDRKYPTGSRTNRATMAGYWKATGKDKEIFQGKALVGMKKTLVFYTGRAPSGIKTNWVMHEYRLEGKCFVNRNLPKSAKEEWVICRVFNKTPECKKVSVPGLVRSPDLPSLMDMSTEDNVVRNRGSSLEDPREKLFGQFQWKDCGADSKQKVISDQFLEGGVDSKQNVRSDHFIQDLCPGVACNEMGFKHFEDLDFPLVANASVDLDCLWYY